MGLVRARIIKVLELVEGEVQNFSASAGSWSPGGSVEGRSPGVEKGVRK
jgi:hypothetical protein